MRVFPEWRHGTAQGLQEHKSRAARARHEVTIESLTYKFILVGSMPHEFKDMPWVELSGPGRGIDRVTLVSVSEPILHGFPPGGNGFRA